VNDTNGPEALDIEALAAQMLGLDSQGDSSYDEDQQGEESEGGYQPVGHPAWQEILSQIPEELHAKVIPTLQQWDAGVSRRFQKIHDEYSSLKEFEDYDPGDIRQALDVYEALNTNPAATWETIGRVYGLSPQEVSQAASVEDDLDFDALPPALKEKLSKIDLHDQVLEYVSQQMLEAQAADEEAAEDEALEEILDELREDYGEFDEDYVVGLIAAGVDPEEAVERFQGFASQFQQQPRQQAPKIMSSGGGVPSGAPADVNKLSNQDTQALIAEVLRLSQSS